MICGKANGSSVLRCTESIGLVLFRCFPLWLSLSAIIPRRLESFGMHAWNAVIVSSRTCVDSEPDRVGNLPR